MIIPVKTPNWVDEIAPLVAKIKNLPYLKEAYLEHIREIIDRDDVLMLVSISVRDEVECFLFAEIVTNVGYKDVFIDLAYIKPQGAWVGRQMLELLNKWALLNKCKNIGLLSDRDKVKAYNRKYGFREKYVYILKEVENERIIPKQRT